ncbi:MAG: serine hydrolase domain-containing protein, partial [Maribacter sp.]
MKNSLYKLLFICFGLLLLTCKQNQTADSKVNVPAPKVSTAYKAPIFNTDDRMAKVAQLGPELEQLMVAHAKAKNIPGIAYGIVVDNELVLSGATGTINLEVETDATPQSVFRIASMTKSFTAMAILKLRDEGKLLLSDPVSKYIPEMAKVTYLTADSPTINIENLLTMTAGFPEDNPWGDRQLHEPDAMLIDLIDQGVSFSNAPSYTFEYSNTGYALLGKIVSRVSGMPYQQYIKMNILQPLGMEHTFWEYDNVPKEQLAIGYRWEDKKWKLEPMLHDGAYGAMGGLITSIEDYSKYVSFQLSAWPPRSDADNGPVKRSSLREMQTPKYPRLYAKATDYNGDPCAVMSGYGYGLG